jgi:23S rRNA (guanine2445-N2)-methyltransferase / 23S rRNA (guanine2069-N7)-methyltransferase
LEKYEFYAVAARGTQAALAAELTGLGAAEVIESPAGVAFAGGLGAAYRACLWSRVATRVLLRLAEVGAGSSDELYDGVRALAWEDHLAAGGTLAVDFTGTNPGITNSHFGALRVKDAICDRFRARSGRRPDVDPAAPDLRVNLHLAGARAVVSVDLSGDSLHRRGYRGGSGEAPLKETLAAAVLTLAGWPELARTGVPLLDPFCGSGTLVIEAALMAADRAPGLERRMGFTRWGGHDVGLWAGLVEEARGRVRERPEAACLLRGADRDPSVVRLAQQNARRAGVEGWTRFEAGEAREARPREGEAPGLLVCNPPYGERLGEVRELEGLYRDLGDTLKRRFPGWTAALFTGNRELASQVGLKPARRHVLWNGPIECRLLIYPMGAEAAQGEEGPAWRKPRPVVLGPGAEMLRNRLRKNLDKLAKWARRAGVTAFRVYDADLPEYNAAIDLYGDAAHVAEYAGPKELPEEVSRARLEEILAVVPDALGVPAGSVFVKVRRRQREGAQYQREGAGGVERVVEEAGLRFTVNLSDYLDTGLFLDHRGVRAWLKAHAAGRDFLNLFCYTGTASVAAAAGQARSTTSVDLSNTYLDVTRRNLELNGFTGAAHATLRADCLAFLREEKRRYGLIFLSPPTFSRSKSMEGTLDVERDQVELLRDTARLLAPGGELIFSVPRRRFKLEAGALPELAFEDLSPRTVQFDFARSAKDLHVWRVTWK